MSKPIVIYLTSKDLQTKFYLTSGVLDMTKKSAGRIARDKLKKEQALNMTNVPVWDDLKVMHDNIAEILATEGGGVAQLFSIPEIVSKLSEPLEITNRIKALDSDVNTYCNALEAIFAQHSERVGDPTDADDNMLAINIAGQYINLESTYRATVFPNIMFLSQVAGDIAEEERQRQLAQNANVVTDVEVKESTTSTEPQVNAENETLNVVTEQVQ